MNIKADGKSKESISEKQIRRYNTHFRFPAIILFMQTPVSPLSMVRNGLTMYL